MQPSAEELTRYSASLRRLARSLLADEQLAEDLVQQTYLVALERPPRSVASLRAWLAEVLRHRALDWLRDQRHREARERAAARPEAEPAHSAETLHACEALLAAVKELDEPYRTAIVLRYFEDQAPAAIAKRLGEPKRTVQTRLHRALQKLRGRLAAHGPHCAVLLPLATPGTELLVHGTLLMSIKKIVVAAAAILLACTAVWTLARDAGEPRVAPAASQAAAASPPRDPARDSAPAVRSEVAPASRPASARPSPDDVLPLHGRVVDVGACPVAGAAVVASRRPLHGSRSLDPDHREARERVAERATDGDGCFAFDFRRADPFVLTVAAPGFAVRTVPEGYGGQQLTVVLERPARVRGTVTRAGGGGGLAGVEVRLAPDDRRSADDRFVTRTGEDGAFAFDSVASGRLACVVTPAEGMPPPVQRFTLLAGERKELTIEVADRPVTRGRVTDAATGEPVARAEVGEGPLCQHATRTDQRGEFCLRGYPSSGDDELCVRAPGYARELVETKPGRDGRVDVKLRRAGKAHGCVVDSEGRGVEAAYVAAVSGDGTSTFDLDWRRARSGADGRFALEDLDPRFPYALWVRGGHKAALVYDLPCNVEPGQDLDLGNFVLPSPSVLEARIVDTRAQPIAGALVVLTGMNRDRGKALGGRPAPRSANGPPGGDYVTSRDTSSDAAGNVRFSELAAGDYELFVKPRGGPHLVRRGIEVPSGEVLLLGDVVFDLGLGIGGRVLHGDRTPVGAAGIRAIAPAGGAREWSTRPAHDGTFEVHGLRPGSYDLYVNLYEDGSGATARWAPAYVAGVAAGTTGLEILLEPASFVSGTVLDARGEPVAGALVLGQYVSHPRLTSAADTTTAADGTFRLPVLPRSVVDLHTDHAPSRSEAGTHDAGRGVPAGATGVVLR